jgi:LPXTG-motif cell wall-anchored protein
MTHDSRSRRRVAAGLASMTIGAVAIVAGLAMPASAHEGKEPAEVPETNSLSCADLADKFDIDANWTESKIEAGDLPDEGESETYDLTPGDTSDAATVTITMNIELKNFDWESTVGIDAVYVKGGKLGSYFYGYQPEVAGYHEPGAGTVVGEGAEATSDVDLGTPPYPSKDEYRTKNQISHITFCWDGEGGSTTSSTSDTTPPSSDCPQPPADGQSGMPNGDGGTPPPSDDDDDTPPAECDTPTTTPPTTAPDTTEPPQDTPTTPVDSDSPTTVGDDAAPVESTTTTWDDTPGGSLPNTGSNTTPLVLGGLALLTLGGVLVAGNKLLRRA